MNIKPLTKICSKCKEIKPLTLFGINKSCLDGYSYNCKECLKIIDRENKKRRLKMLACIDKPDEDTNYKLCPICKDTKLLKYFRKNNASKDGKTTRCRYCLSKRDREFEKNKTVEQKTKSKQKTTEATNKLKQERKERLEQIYKNTDALTKTFKICKKCETNKSLSEYGIDWYRADGRRSVCKECNQEHERWRHANDPKFKERVNNKNKKYKCENKEKLKEYSTRQDVKQKNSVTRRKNLSRRLAEDEKYATIYRLRSSVNSNLKRYSEKGKVYTSKKYGLDYISIFEHLGPRPGDDYEIDHIVPCSVFSDLNIPGMITTLYHPSNLQWLPKDKNLMKWNHIIPDLIRDKNLEWICDIVGINLADHEENNCLLNIIKQED